MDGIIIVNKEQGWTSNDVVQKAKRLFNTKVGHTGTLDPIATGVLPLLVGKGTLLSKYLINHNKEYIATIKLGQKTITGDREGEVLEKKEVIKELLKEERVKKVLESFIGKQKQFPPIYSAIKVNGRKLYEYARKGQNVNIEPRDIEIYNIELIKLDALLNEITYKVNCSKGTYIRSLCEDIAKKMETLGFMKELNRTKVGTFSIENAYKIKDIQDNFENKDWINKNFITIEKFFCKYPVVKLDDMKIKQWINGVKMPTKKEDGVYKIYDNNNFFLGTAIVTNGIIKRDIVL